MTLGWLVGNVLLRHHDFLLVCFFLSYCTVLCQRTVSSLLAYYGVPRRTSRKYHGLRGVEDNRRACDELFVTRFDGGGRGQYYTCLLYTSPSPRDGLLSRMPSSA